VVKGLKREYNMKYAYNVYIYIRRNAPLTQFSRGVSCHTTIISWPLTISYHSLSLSHSLSYEGFIIIITTYYFLTVLYFASNIRQTPTSSCIVRVSFINFQRFSRDKIWRDACVGEMEKKLQPRHYVYIYMYKLLFV